MSEPVPLDLQDVEREARQLLQRARQAGAELLRRARDKAAQVLEASRRSGHDSGYQAGLDEGRRAGTEEARRLESARLQNESAPLLEALRALLGEIEKHRARLMQDAERELLDLALRIAEKVVSYRIEVDKRALEESVRDAIQNAASKHSLEVRLHPEDCEHARKFLSRLEKEFEGLQVVQLGEDESVGRGGCMVATPEGKVDATIETKLAELRRILLG